MNSLRRTLVATLLTAVCVVAMPANGRAAFIVSLDTSRLPSGNTYAIDFQFALGGPNTSNTATVSGITFGTGGSAGSAGTAQAVGSVTGNFQTQPITLSGASGGFADFTQNFTPGSRLQFTVTMTDQAQPNGGLDSFTFAVLYFDSGAGGFLNITTSNPNSNNAFLEVDTNTNRQLTIIASASTDPMFPVPAPSAQLVAVPEPSAFCLVILGIPALLVARRWL